MDMNSLGALLPAIQAFLPMLKPQLPSITQTIASFIPTYLESMSDKYNVQSVHMILENQVHDGKPVAILKYMSLKNGRLEPIMEENGQAKVELFSTFVSRLAEIGLQQIEKAGTDE